LENGTGLRIPLAAENELARGVHDHTRLLELDCRHEPRQLYILAQPRNGHFNRCCLPNAFIRLIDQHHARSASWKIISIYH
jgi:hypothetical protein